MRFPSVLSCPVLPDSASASLWSALSCPVLLLLLLSPSRASGRGEGGQPAGSEAEVSSVSCRLTDRNSCTTISHRWAAQPRRGDIVHIAAAQPASSRTQWPDSSSPTRRTRQVRVATSSQKDRHTQLSLPISDEVETDRTIQQIATLASLRPGASHRPSPASR